MVERNPPRMADIGLQDLWESYCIYNLVSDLKCIENDGAVGIVLLNPFWHKMDNTVQASDIYFSR